MIRSAQLAADFEAFGQRFLELSGTVAQAAELIDPQAAPEIEVAALLARDLQACLAAHRAGQNTPAAVADHLLMTSAELAKLVKN